MPSTYIPESFIPKRRDLSYSAFALQVLLDYIKLLVFKQVADILFQEMNLRGNIVAIFGFGTFVYLINAVFPLKDSFGFRGWSNFSEARQPKMIMAIVCWPVFLVWLVATPFRLLIVRLRRINN